MPNYLLAYRGGAMSDDPAEQEQAMTAWMDWFGSLGAAVVDGGAPFAASAALDADRRRSPSTEVGLTGYSIISADSLDEACSKAHGCPVLAAGGTIDVYEAAAMG